MKDNFSSAKGADPIRHLNKKVEGFFGRLVDFLKEWSVIGVAIGFVVGSATLDFVNAVVKGIVIPAFKLLFGANNLSDLSFIVGQVKFDVGNAFSSFVTLLIIITFLYYLVRRIMKKYGQN